MRKNITVLAALLSFAFVISCGPPKDPVTGGGGGGGGGAEPGWVGNPPKGCAAGSSKLRGIKDIARKAAVASARDELARQLKTHVAGMIKTYQNSAEAEGQQMAEEDITAVSRQVVDQTMVGTRTVRTQIMEGEMYGLVCLDTETFSGAFDKMNKMNDKMKTALKKRADAEFKDMDKQIEKLRAR